MIQGERLLAPDVLAGSDDLPSDLGMHGGHREVDDDLDVVAREEVIDGPGCRDPEGRGLGGRALQVEIGHEARVDIGEPGQVLEVRTRDDAGADQADAGRAEGGGAAHAALDGSFACNHASESAMPSNTSPA